MKNSQQEISDGRNACKTQGSSKVDLRCRRLQGSWKDSEVSILAGNQKISGSSI